MIKKSIINFIIGYILIQTGLFIFMFFGDMYINFIKGIPSTLIGQYTQFSLILLGMILTIAVVVSLCFVYHFITEFLKFREQRRNKNG